MYTDTIQQDSNPEEDRKLNLKLAIVIVSRLVASIIALYLMANCCRGENIIMQLLYGSVAFMFPEAYILYYAVYRVLMGNSCSVPVPVPAPTP